MVEPRPHLAGKVGIGGGVRPVEQQVVVVEYVLRLLRGGVGCEETLELFFPMRAPGKGGAQHTRERHSSVDRSRVKREARPLARKARLARA